MIDNINFFEQVLNVGVQIGMPLASLPVSRLLGDRRLSPSRHPQTIVRVAGDQTLICHTLYELLKLLLRQPGCVFSSAHAVLVRDTLLHHAGEMVSSRRAQRFDSDSVHVQEHLHQGFTVFHIAATSAGAWRGPIVKPGRLYHILHCRRSAATIVS